MLISFVIPCYRSENTIALVVEEIFDTMKQREEYSIEIILVNDFSPDNTWNVLKTLSSKYEQVKIIDLSRNFGQPSAVMAGFSRALGDVIVGMDDDGQMPPSEVFKLLDKLEEGYDLVFARYPQKMQSIFRNIGSFINDSMARYMINVPRDVVMNSYFCVKRYIIQDVLSYKNAYPYIGGLLLRGTDRVTNVSINHNARMYGKSGYTLRKCISTWLNGFTTFSVKPLRISTFSGIILAFVGFADGIYVVVRKLMNPDIAVGYSSIMAAIMFIGGMIMLMLGMIGEYVGRIYMSINSSPQYVVRETINFKNKTAEDDR